MKPKHNYKKPARSDPVYDGFQYIANQTKMMNSPDATPLLALEKHTGSLRDALRYVGSRSKMPRVNPAEEEKRKADERLATLQ